MSVDAMKKIKIWNYTYGPIDVRIYNLDKNSINIWSYCSIGPECEFICGFDHNTSHISTYPFWLIDKKKAKERKLEIKKEEFTKWPIVVDDDVWIWTWAKIMSWVHIWQWAVIAAWAVVTKDIPPYAIAGWVPAKVIKYRFSEDKIKKLLQIDYSNIPIEKFREIYPETIKEDFDIDYILKKLKE